MTKKEIRRLVKSWEWNLSIFQIYDLLVVDYEKQQEEILRECAKHFSDSHSLNYFQDLADHLEIDMDIEAIAEKHNEKKLSI